MKIGISTVRKDHELFEKINAKYDVLFMESEALKNILEQGNPDHMDLILFDYYGGYEYGINDSEFLDTCRKIELPILALIEPWLLFDDSDLPIVRRVETVYPENILSVLSEWAVLDEVGRKMRCEYTDLCGRWETSVDQDPFEQYEQYEELLQIVYNTFTLYKRLFSENKSLPYNRLEPYKYAGMMYFYLDLYAMPCKEIGSFIDCLDGLLHLFETGFDAGYKENVLPLKRHKYDPGCGPEIEADMTSLDSFRKSFEENSKIWQRYYEE